MKAPAAAADSAPGAVAATIPAQRKGAPELQTAVPDRSHQERPGPSGPVPEIPKRSRNPSARQHQQSQPQHYPQDTEYKCDDGDDIVAAVSPTTPIRVVDTEPRHQDQPMSPIGSPSPVRQLAFQLENTALDDGPSPAQTGHKWRHGKSQQRAEQSENTLGSTYEAQDLDLAAWAVSGSRGPVLLVLGDELQAMPWESLPGLRSERYAA